jgi:hypothetical protein
MPDELTVIFIFPVARHTRESAALDRHNVNLRRRNESRVVWKLHFELKLRSLVV